MDKIEEILTRGVENIIPNREALGKLLRSSSPLNIYNGIDPTNTKIHIGNAVPLRKLQEFVKLGHHVTFLIGDFTARVGDTSDKDSERPILTPDQIEENFQSYKKQAEKFLDFSKVKVVHNSEWLSKLKFGDILPLLQHFSLNDFISRELIKKRLNSGGHVRLDEVIYPIMQGYDSYIMDTDIQVGGTDQTFNMQAGRVLQKDLRNKESFVLSLGFLEGTDGRKMSKSWGNAIWVEDSPDDMFGKLMSVRDDLIIRFFTLGTNVPMEDVAEKEAKLKSGENPMVLKKELAFQIVSELHTRVAAQEAQEQFEKAFQEKDLKSLPTISIPINSVNSGTSITSALAESGTVASKSEAKRLLNQGAIEFNDKVLHSDQPVQAGIYKVGKKKAVKFE